MVIPILATKLYIPPPRPKVVLRLHLIERLNQALADGHTPRVILISAPAGFGKTTLVSEWIEYCKLNATGSKSSAHQQSMHAPDRPPGADVPQVQVSKINNPQFCWLSLDEGDSDPIRFLTYLVAALRMVTPNFGERVLAELQSPQPPPVETILTALLNDITTLPEQTALVLDDYHRIDSLPVDASISVNGVLSFLLEHLPPQMTPVITTREDPNLPLARLRVQDQLTELRVADLRFSPTEAAGFFDQMMGLNLSAEDITALENRTEGWVAGLQLAALAMRSMPGHKDVTSFIKSFSGTHHYVMDYLIEEVLQQQSERVQTFLLRTAILDRLCGPLCDAVLLDPSTSGQRTAGQTTLEYIERANLFIIPLDNERHWYRYHHLFADLLRQRLSQSQTPEAIAQYHISASEWYEKNGDIAEAFRHLIAAREYGRAAGLAEMFWQAMYDSFQSAIWLGWVKQLPEEIICSRPVLCTQIAWGLMNAHEVDASESRLRDAERCLLGTSDGMVIVDQEQFRSLQARIAFARAYNAQTRRDFLSAIKYAELVNQLIPEENQILRAQTSAILGATYLINGDLDAACRSMDDWTDHSIKVGNYFSAFAYAMAEKADILTAQGHLREALRTYQQALELASQHESGVLRVTAHHYLGMAMLYHEMGDDQAADQHLQKSIDLAGIHMSVDWSYRRCVGQARIKESAGDLDTAINLLDEAKRFYIKTLIPHTRPIEAIKARIYLKQGRLDKAEEWVNKQGLTADDELIYLREFEQITQARVLLAKYQYNRDEHVILKALRLLDRLLKAAEDRNRMGSVLEILVTQVLVYQRQGNASMAFTSLERALVLAQPEGYVRIFVDEGDPMRSLLLDFRKAGNKQPRSDNVELMRYVDQLLSTFTPPSDVKRPQDMQPSKRFEPEAQPTKTMLIEPAPHIEAKVQPAKNGLAVSESLIEPLSQRELEVLRLFKTELSGPEIAQELMIALSMVRTYTKSIYSKLNVNSRRAAVRRAAELKLI